MIDAVPVRCCAAEVKKRLRGFTLGLLLLVALGAGCVHALNPFYRAKDVVFDPALLGLWSPDGTTNASEGVWKFEAGEGQAYGLTCSGEKDGVPESLEFEVHLFRLGEERFLDVIPTGRSAEKVSEPYGWLGFFRPTHTAIHLPKAAGGRLPMQALKDDPFKPEKGIKNLPARESYGDGRIVLTGSTRELQGFLRRTLKEDGWWNDTETLMPVKLGAK